MTFLLSSLMLLLGPLLVAAGERYRGSRQVVDGFILVVITGIVCLHIVPEAWRILGPVSLMFLLAGLAFPVLLEAAFSKTVERAHLAVLTVAAIGIVVHAVLDGIALLPIGAGGSLLGNELALGVILHRLPVGMAIWWVLRPQFGTTVANLTFGLVICATGLSYFFGADLVGTAQASSLAGFQSFVAGSLVHVVLFGISHEHDTGDRDVHDHDHAHEPANNLAAWPFRVGLLLGLVMVFVLPHIPAF